MAETTLRRLLTTDAINLKAKVKAEMKRRKYSGSVASYGGTAYDFTTTPTNNSAVKGEHLKKNLEPMQAVNGSGLPTYPGKLTRAGQEAMEAKIDAWETRSASDRSGTDCASGCTGMCYTGCESGCYGCGSGCADDCDGCDGCSGCGSGCADSCSGDCDAGCKGDFR